MYRFSDASVDAAVWESINNFTIPAKIDGLIRWKSGTGALIMQPIYDDIIVAGSLSITNQCSSDTELQIGQVYVGELNITLTDVGEFDNYMLLDPETSLDLSWGINVNNRWQYVPLGKYHIAEADKTAAGYVIRAYDNMSLFDVPYEPVSMSGTPREIVLAACTACGVTLGTTETEWYTFPNHNVTLTATQQSDSDGNKSIPQIKSYRDLLAYIAQVTCTNAIIGRDGKLYFRPYPSTAVSTIDTSHRHAGGMTANFETYYDGILVTDPETKTQNKYTRANPTGLTMDLGDNPFINTAAIRADILNGLTFRYHPFRMNVLNAPLYDLMDCIHLPGGIGDGTMLYCITKFIWTYHGSYQLSGAGQDPKLVAVASAAQRSAAQAAFIAAQKVTTDQMDDAINSATAQITGNRGGYLVWHDSDGDDMPDELLVMNTPSINTATKVWRFNLAGLGHSNDGYSGTYGLALTADGNIVANKVVVGTLGDLAGVNYWNMVTGDARFSGDIVARSLTLGTGVSIGASKISGLASVATSGQYSDIANTPDLTVYVEQDHQYGSAASASSTGFKVTSNGLLTASNAVIFGSIYATSLTLGAGVSIASSKVTGLASVATSGSYNDLSNKPTIPSLNGYIYQDGTVGSTPAEGATGFVVSRAGALQASNAIIYGTLYSSAGKIGGMTLANNALYHGTDSMASTTPGVYLGTNGLRIYKDADSYINLSASNGITARGGSFRGSSFISEDGTVAMSSNVIRVNSAASIADSLYSIAMYRRSSDGKPFITFNHRDSVSDSWATDVAMIGFDSSGTYAIFDRVSTPEYDLRYRMTSGTSSVLTSRTLIEEDPDSEGSALLYLNNVTPVGTVKGFGGSGRWSYRLIPAKTVSDLGYVTLTKGTWIIKAQLAFSTAETDPFAVSLALSTAADRYITGGVSRIATSKQGSYYMQVTYIYQVTGNTSTNMHLVCYSESNNDLDVQYPTNPRVNYIHAVCIA